MRIFYDATRNEIHVDATVDVWPARSLAVRITPAGLMIYKANAGVDVLGPLGPAMVQTADGTPFADQPSALVYLQGEFAKDQAPASAYDVAVANGFVGTQGQWLASLAGQNGASGRTVEIEVVAVGGAQPIAIPGPFSAVQSLFRNGLRERMAAFSTDGGIVTLPSFTEAGDIVSILYLTS